MKVIIYTRPDGGLSVVQPAEGARLAFFITTEDGTRIPSGDGPFEAVPADTILRTWPVAGAVAEWAETEDEFVARIAAKDVPAGTPFSLIDPSELPADRAHRGAWRYTGAAIVIDEVERQKIDAARAAARPKTIHTKA